MLEFLLALIKTPKFYVPIITIVISIIIISLSGRLVKSLINKDDNSIVQKRKNTIVVLMQNIIKYIIILLAAVIILNSWGVNVAGMVAGLGVVGVVAGLAIQDALKDIIMGCNIIMDNFFVVGDLVTYNNFTGEVIEFGLKNTKIRNYDGTVLVVSNRNISELTNLSQKNATLLIRIPTAYEEKESKVSKVLLQACTEIDKLDISTGKSEYLGLDNLGDSCCEYLINAHCNPGDRYALKRKVLSIVKDLYEKNNIKIPYPQIEVHNYGKRN